MRKVLQRFARLMAFIVFLILVAAGYDFSQLFSWDIIIPVVAKALFGSILFWICSIIIADIIIKGVVEDIDQRDLEPLEGGLEQRLHEIKSQKDVNVVKKDVSVVYKEK